MKTHMVEVDGLMFSRGTDPFGKPWEKWAEIWCKWLLSIPRKINPAVDDTGKNSSQGQTDANVWFLAGTFGNNVPVRRSCTVPASKAILFSILDKEDSFAEDLDIKTEEELAIRAKNSMDRLVHLQACVDGRRLQNLRNYRVRSEFFDLTFPEDNVYDVNPGLTRSICDGYWVFLKPLAIGSHKINFSGEVLLPRDDPVTELMKDCSIYQSILGGTDKNSTFKIEVSYDLIVN